MLELKVAVDEILKKTNFRNYFLYTNFEKTTVLNLLESLQKKIKDVKLDEDNLRDAIKETVESYSNNKSSAIKIFGIFLEFLKKQYAFDVQVNFPKVDIANSFERQMYLAKELQSSEKTVSVLSEELWVGVRTIEDDILRLRGRTNDPIQICGKPFVVNEMRRRKGRMSFASTVHPLFLTFNLTQVISTLKGLKHMCDDFTLKQYALISASAIWQQLSEYAKERIIYVSTNIMPDEVDWYKSLENINRDMFYTEYQCGRTEGAGVLADCIKNGKSCFLEYLEDESKTVFLSNCMVVKGSYKDDTIEVLCDEGEYLLDIEKVLRSAYTKNELI